MIVFVNTTSSVEPCDEGFLVRVGGGSEHVFMLTRSACYDLVRNSTAALARGQIADLGGSEPIPFPTPRRGRSRK